MKSPADTGGKVFTGRCRSDKVWFRPGWQMFCVRGGIIVKFFFVPLNELMTKAQANDRLEDTPMVLIIIWGKTLPFPANGFPAVMAYPVMWCALLDNITSPDIWTGCKSGRAVRLRVDCGSPGTGAACRHGRRFLEPGKPV
jgi:hypothetical protein